MNTTSPIARASAVIARISIFVLLTMATTVTCAQPPAFKIVGYYSLDRAMNGVSNKTLKRLTHINLWFLNPDSLGNFTRDLSGLDAFVRKAHRKNVKVLISIGGGSKHPQYHTLLKEGNREMLIRNLLSQVNEHDFDGVDVDLEGSDIDDHYENFVLELAEQLGANHKLITAAIAVYYKDQLTDGALAAYDFVNIMSYDRTGPWQPNNPGPHSTLANAKEDLDYFAGSRRIPKEKMTLGVPFYGYGFGPDTLSKVISMNYGEIVKKFPRASSADQWTMPDGKILYYNGKSTIVQKTRLAGEAASGIMIWQLAGDAKGHRSLLKAIQSVAKGKTP